MRGKEWDGMQNRVPAGFEVCQLATLDWQLFRNVIEMDMEMFGLRIHFLSQAPY